MHDGRSGEAMIRRLLVRSLAVVTWVAIAILLAIVIVPPFLDRIYYRGPATAHFDGQHFFNPEGEQGNGGSRTRSPARWIGFLMRLDRPDWPEDVPVAAVRPAARIDGIGPGGVPALRVTWIGHATVVVQTRGLNILTDPIWSARASPVGFVGPRRVRAPAVRFADLPPIDVVLVSHNHYDHLDLDTLERLWRRDRPLILTSLGNDAVLRRRGIPAVTRDWGGAVSLGHGMTAVVERVHHWGSRWGADRNRALWSGFTLTMPGGNLYFAGDTGWGDGAWIDAAAARGPIRLALIPIGAYRPRALMSGNHIGPPEAVAVAERLHAAHALAIHWGTFQLADEGFGQAPRDLAAALRGQRIDFRSPPPGAVWDVPG
ncbi:MAG: MBL fold metallo-hydrolase [Sphingomonas fennica]